MIEKRDNNQGLHGIRVKKSSVEWLFIILLLLFSFINSMTLLISMIFILFLLKQKQVGAIKVINILTLRTIINPGIAIGMDSWQNLKWIILFCCALYLIISFKKLNMSDWLKVRSIILLVLVFGLYSVITAFIFSSLPIVAIFKLVSYIFIFLSVIIGVGITYKKFDWIGWMLKLYLLILLPSIIFIGLPLGYLRNGYSFQGITNQPNMLGIVLVLFVAIVLAYLEISKKKYSFHYLLLFIAITMVILSKSRTSLIGCIILILLFIVLLNLNKTLKISLVSLGSVGSIFVLLSSNIEGFLSSFFLKGQESGNILYSRLNQLDSLLMNFWDNPLFGKGFMVPVLPYKSYEFSSDYIIEAGNLFIAVLSFSGIFGFLIFLTYIFKIFWMGNKRLIYLPISTILISMGEMVFFSSNNIGIWLYMYLSLYLFYRETNFNVVDD
ncbi:O-antigen ligase family protein [Sporosarcina sp. Sa2YVA2]|uniref:O-antigen ligase family protein n=1 Tax=Sporosarcina quadrami TaxID=2762234 RepID=A0ABR8U963_9BACL|nr:O-antigen ligase family protein [Sporosarcina quadrami]MBD7984579.1 O-antigen ligase family protein [Sporosarcina quadrami]